MSESFAHEGGIDPDGWAPTSGGAVDESIAAEIADHLAAAAEDLVKRGETEQRAIEQALAQFGNVERVKRQCWWIQKGDEVMFRTLGVAVLSLLTIGVVAVALGGWQLGRNLASRTEELSEQLASLTATQQAMLAQQRPPSVSGRCYLGDPSKPAKNVEVQVFRFSEEPHARTLGVQAPGVVTRRLRTDSDGRFDAGILQAGEYCLLAPILDPAGAAKDAELIFKRWQCRPLNLIAGVGELNIDLDLAATAQLRLSTLEIPNTIQLAGEPWRVFVHLQLLTENHEIIFERTPVPPSDEPPRNGWPLPLPSADANYAAAMLRPSDLPHMWCLPTREYFAQVHLSIWAPEQSDQQSPVRYSALTPITFQTRPAVTTTLNVSLRGEPLAQLLEAAIKKWEVSSAVKIDSPDASQSFLNGFVKEIQLKVEQSEQASTTVQ